MLLEGIFIFRCLEKNKYVCMCYVVCTFIQSCIHIENQLLHSALKLSLQAISLNFIGKLSLETVFRICIYTANIFNVFFTVPIPTLWLQVQLNNCKADLLFFTVTSTLGCIRQSNVNCTVRLQWKVGHN